MIELALQEVQKGLMLDRRHPLLRTSLGYLRFRQGEFKGAIAMLEAVVGEDRALQIRVRSVFTG